MNNILGLVWFFVVVGNVRGDGFVVPTEHSNGCVAIETSYAISKILSASPSSFVMSFAIDPSAAYDKEHGPGSSKKSEHREQFQCALKIVDQVNQITDSFLDKIINYIEYRKSAYMKSIKGKRDIDEGGPVTKNSRIPRSFSEPMILGEEEIDLEKLIWALSEVSFVQNQTWLAERMRRKISAETNFETNDTLSDSRTRFRWDPVSFVATVIAISSLSVSLGSTIYLSNRREKLIDYVSDLSSSMSDILINQNHLKNNLIVLKDAYGLMSLGATQMGGVLKANVTISFQRKNSTHHHINSVTAMSIAL